MTGTKILRPVHETPFWQAYMRSRYGILFYALLFTLLVLPLATTIGLPAVMIKLLLGMCFIAAVMPNATRNSRFMLLVAGVLLVAARVTAEQDFVPMSPAIFVAFLGLVGLLAAAGSLRFAMKVKSVGSEMIYAALSTYLLAGIFFGQIYWSIESFSPGSIIGPDPVTELNAVYYSFVTLATLGYGDFLPRTDLARGVATFEVIGGQLFLAVMVARLIGTFAPGAAPGISARGD